VERALLAKTLSTFSGCFFYANTLATLRLWMTADMAFTLPAMSNAMPKPKFFLHTVFLPVRFMYDG
jgi:hypothetical protein